MNIYHSNTYRKDLSWLHFDDEPRVQGRQQVKDQQSCITVFVATSPDMTKIFHAWPYGRFIEIQSNLWRKKLHRTNHGSNFLGSSSNNRGNIGAPIQFRRESQPQHLKR